MTDKRNQRDPKKAFPTWTAALAQACVYGWQTGRKYRIRRSGDAFRIQRTDRPYTAGLGFVARWTARR